jgi:hypothetical protein
MTTLATTIRSVALNEEMSGVGSSKRCARVELRTNDENQPVDAVEDMCTRRIETAVTMLMRIRLV